MLRPERKRGDIVVRTQWSWAPFFTSFTGECNEAEAFVHLGRCYDSRVQVAVTADIGDCGLPLTEIFAEARFEPPPRRELGAEEMFSEEAALYDLEDMGLEQAIGDAVGNSVAELGRIRAQAIHEFMLRGASRSVAHLDLQGYVCRFCQYG